MVRAVYGVESGGKVRSLRVAASSKSHVSRTSGDSGDRGPIDLRAPDTLTANSLLKSRPWWTPPHHSSTSPFTDSTKSAPAATQYLLFWGQHDTAEENSEQDGGVGMGLHVKKLKVRPQKSALTPPIASKQLLNSVSTSLITLNRKGSEPLWS